MKTIGEKSKYMGKTMEPHKKVTRMQKNTEKGDKTIQSHLKKLID